MSFLKFTCMDLKNKLHLQVAPSDDLIGNNQESQDISLNQNVITNSRTSTPKRIMLRKRLNLSSSPSPKLINEKVNCSGMKPEACNIFQYVKKIAPK